MILYPDAYIDDVTKITPEFLKKHNIKGLILDVDNTLLDYNKKTVNGLEDWFKEIKNQNIVCCILSNSNKKEKVKNIADQLGIPFIYFGCKPFKRGYKKARKVLNLENKEIAVAGDQLFTDVLGANRCKMFSILVKPIDKKDIWITVIKRPIENYIIKKYKEKKREK